MYQELHDKLKKAIQLKDYKYVYNKLNQSFKDTNFKTQKDFENFIKENHNVEYYDKQIEKIRAQISNVREGRPKNEGVYDVNSRILSKEEAQKEIVRLDSKLKDAQKARNEAVKILIDFDNAENNTFKIANQIKFNRGWNFKPSFTSRHTCCHICTSHTC